MSKILIVEDEINVQKPLADHLQKEGFQVLVAGTLAEADQKVQENPDLVLLDWMLPDGQGIEILKQWRARGLNVPTLLVTARADLIDKVVGLELGADDYITKPFEPRELVARIRVQLRNRSVAAAPATSQTLEAGEIKLQPSNREASYQGKTLDLTKTEYDLLKLLMENPNQVFSREELLKQVWGYDKSPTTRTVDTHVLQLRQKTDAELFETVHGIGYRLRTKK